MGRKKEMGNAFRKRAGKQHVPELTPVAAILSSETIPICKPLKEIAGARHCKYYNTVYILTPIIWIEYG